LLAEAARRVREQGFEIGNVDSTVIAQAPKLAPHIAAMRRRIAQVLGVDLAQVNVKAKTAEKMGPLARALPWRRVQWSADLTFGLSDCTLFFSLIPSVLCEPIHADQAR
jgi:F420-0:gamma-glutamyl ligase-like protein